MVDYFFEILKITLPALLVGGSLLLYVRAQFKRDLELRQEELRIRRSEVALPIRLQAYERLILFMERISPGNLLVRLAESELSARQLQLSILAAVQQEYEHNMSQQLYVSNQAWQELIRAKDDLLLIVNEVAGEFPQTGTGLELSHALLSEMDKRGFDGIVKAVNTLKKEAANLGV